MKKRIVAAVMTFVLALGIMVASATPAEACYGNTVSNRSIGWVQVQLDNKNYVWLAGFSAQAKNVGWIVIGARQTVAVGTKVYFGGTWGYLVKASCGQISVSRIS